MKKKKIRGDIQKHRKECDLISSIHKLGGGAHRQTDRQRESNVIS
jgi:hypothetical protein